MPKYYLKSTNANVEILCQYLNHTKCLQMQNIKENGIKIIRKNVLSTICNLNIKHPTGNQHISIIGQKKMSNSHQIHHQQIYVKRLCPNFLLILHSINLILREPRAYKAQLGRAIVCNSNGIWEIRRFGMLRTPRIS